MKMKKKRKKQEKTILRIISIKGGSAICEMSNGREVSVNFQNIPFEVEIGDNLEAMVYYEEDLKIENIVIIRKK